MEILASPHKPGAACVVCGIVALIWSLTILAATGYVVFVLNRSGWWFLLALILIGGWKCPQCKVWTKKDEDEE